MGMGAWHDEPVEIEPVGGQQPQAGKRQAQAVAFDMPRHQPQKRHGKVAQQQKDTDGAPAFGKTVAEPFGFFGDVAVPNEHELRESDVAPKEIEAKHEFAHVMVVLNGDGVAQKGQRLAEPASTK